MKFGNISLKDAEGTILAHTLRLGGRVLRKGRTLTKVDISDLQAADIKTVAAAQLEEGDLDENEAALKIAQALTNLLKNASESIEARLTNKSLSSEPGKITLRLINSMPDMASQSEWSGAVTIIIEDNGIGLPVEKGRLTEPYVTTREKGTGLGLAIVRKIMEDHHGRFILDDLPNGGASVTMILESAKESSETASNSTNHRLKTQAGS